YFNPAFKKTTGYTDSILGKPVQTLEKTSVEHSAYQRLKHCIQTGESWEGKTTSVKANGEAFSSRMHISPVFEHNNITHFVTIIQDMTQYDLLEVQLLQAQKTEGMGTLVGGIAHDFNNNLAAIMGNTYLAKISIHEGRDQNTLDKINNIESLSKHAAKVVAQLMAYARQDIIQKENISLSTVIKESLLLSSITMPENILCTTHITDADDDLIFADKSQIQQMLMNLLNNARDALEKTAQPRIKLTLKAKLVGANFHKRNPSISTLHFMRLSIQDNGHGISKEVLPLIFDPFFTTKDVGSGTGLGLSMVFGMVQSHDGIIEIDSTVGKGTTFHIYFPMAE
ncbi:MAG: ATP-binding protein, partial [Ghiorsea sp.]|nr:ATP-binding protein [Ghiorsea sp.]